MKKHPTELIIFDLGRVLVDFDFKKVIRDLKRYSPKSEEQIREYFRKTALWDKFERGQVTPAQFFKSLSKDLKLKKLEFDEFVPLWNDIFQIKQDIVDILSRLHGRYRLAMISNVNQMHWDHVNVHYPFMRLFDYRVASYAVGHRKPDLEIFHLTLRQAGVAPASAIFFDDILSHIHAARSVGIRAHQFKTAAQLISDLKGIL